MEIQFENVPWKDGGMMSDCGGAMLGVMENGDWEMEEVKGDLTVGTKGATVEADPNKSPSE